MIQDEITYQATHLSLIFLSEVEKHCEEHKISRKQLCKTTGITMASFTRFFRGDATLSMKHIAMIQIGLSMVFKIELKEHFPLNISTEYQDILKSYA